MLYERWRQIAQLFRTEIALRDCASGRNWTFGELLRDAENSGESNSSRVHFPQGMSPEFILAVLRGWRTEQVLCPLEEGQTPPSLRDLPKGCVHLKSTSASTGVPRMIAFTGGQLAADADQIVATMGLRSDWPNIGVISLAHSYGFSNLVLPLLLHGVPLILATSSLPESVRQAASLAPEVTLPGVPALWRAWHDASAIPTNLRLAISAGAPLALEIESTVYQQCGLKIHNFYGASECGGIAYDASPQPRSDSTCVGSALRNVQLALDEDGCLQVSSGAVGQGYWPEPSPCLGAGRYQTSDLAMLDNGLVFLRGRKTDQINVAGRKVSPESIERILATHPGVWECLVFGAPSPDVDRTEIIVACVATQTETTAEMLKQHLLKTLPAWQVPRDWWFLPHLGPNQRGKLSRREWRQNYLARKKSKDCASRAS